MVKIDLKLYPHFFGPNDRENVPGIKQITEGVMARDATIVSLSACHPSANSVDRRFYDYVDEAINEKMSIASDNSYKSFKVRDALTDGKQVLFLNSQIVRAEYADGLADVNVIGSGEIIQPGESLEDTISRGRENGGIVLLCNVGERCGLDIEESIRFYKEGRVDGIEVAAIYGKKQKELLTNVLGSEGIKGVAVTGGHSYRFANESYCTFDDSLARDFTFEKLRNAINAGEFTPHHGQLSRWNRFMTRDRHIYASAPGHLLGGAARRIPFLKAILSKPHE